MLNKCVSIINSKSYLPKITFAAALLLVITSATIQHHFNEHKQEQSRQSLQTILKTSHQAITSWVNQHKSTASLWSESPDIITVFNELNTEKKTSPKDLLDHPAQKTIREHMYPLLASSHYAGFFLISRNNINLSSSRDSNIGKKNLMSGKGGFLKRIWAGETIITTPIPSDVPLTSIDGSYGKKAPTMFVGAPIRNNKGEVIGILTLRIDPGVDFTKILNQANIGETGETIAFNLNGLLLNNSRFDKSLHNLKILDKDKSSMLNFVLYEHQKKPTINPGMASHKKLIAPVQAAITGKDGVNTQGYTDYRGITTIGAWLWDKDLGFGILTQQATDEAYLLASHIILSLNSLTIAGLFILLLTSYIHHISKKIILQNETQYSHIVNTVMDAVISIDTNANICSFNTAAEKIFGYARDEVIGKSVDILTPENASINHSTQISNYINNHQSKRIGAGCANLLARRKDGSEFPIDITLSEDNSNEQPRFIGVLRDITERVKAEQQIKQERDKAQHYLDSVEAIVLLVNLDGKIELINRKGCELLGYTKKELLGRYAINIIIPEENRLEAMDYFTSLTKGERKSGEHHEEKIETKNGALLDIVWRTGFIYDDNNNIKQILSSGIDITQSRLLEKERDQQQLLFESVFNDVPDSIIITNAQQKIIKINNSFHRNFGYKQSEVVGHTTDFLIDNPEDYGYDEFIKTRFPNNSLGEHFIINYKKHSGDIFPGETTGAPLHDRKGAVQGSISVIRDVTERIRSENILLEHENTLQSALAAVNAGTFSYDIATSNIYIDQRSQEIFDLHFENKVGKIKQWQNILHPDDKLHILKKLDQSLSSDDSYDIIYRILTISGKVKHIHSRGLITRLPDGSPSSIKGLNLDITHEFLINEERQVLQQQLQQAQKMESIGQLTGGIAHDFNNMLASILGFTQLSQKRAAELNDQKLNSYLNHVSIAGDRARNLVKQMLSFSRTESNIKTTSNINLIIDEVSAMLRPVIPSSIDIHTRLHDQPLLVDVDPVQLHQVITNLCINARDAMNGKGSVHITTKAVHIINDVCASCHQKISGDFTGISIKDDGPGITHDILDNIFEPFFSTKDIGKGTGMGLSMVHGIIHKHAGHIILNTNMLSGSEFLLLLTSSSNGDISHDQQTEPVSTQKPASHGKHILLVDDELSLTTLFSSILGDNNYEVTSFNNSLDALSNFIDNPDKYDALITDQTMPHLTGIELIQEIHKVQPDFPVIMQTGYTDQLDDETIKSLELRGLLKKPVDIDTMISVVNDIF